jgi:Tfp pilus assembly protein PilV
MVVQVGSKSDGFTLLEVLLAGFLLFLTISAMTMVYRGAVLSSDKADSSMSVSASAPSIRRLVTAELRASEQEYDRSGFGQFGAMDYSWQAKTVYQGRPSLEILEVNGSGDVVEYFLWEVELTIRKKNLTRKYSFTELSW